MDTFETSYKFPKEERLCSKKAIEYIFEHGNTLRSGVLKFFYAFDPPIYNTKAPVSVAFAASKRQFKRAVDRNLLKRRMRESFRLHRHILSSTLTSNHHTIIVLIKYQKKTILSYNTISSSMKEGIKRLAEKSQTVS